MASPDAADPQHAGERYEALLEEAGGVDLQILGIGANGHIGFNEPGSGPDDPTRIVDLQPATRAQSAAYWDGKADIPAQAMTIGLGTILPLSTITIQTPGARPRLHGLCTGCA